MELGLDPPNPATEIASLIERGEFNAVASLKELLDKIPTARNVILAAGFRALGARKCYFEKGSGVRLWEADYRTQLDAVKWLAGYSDGLPTQTTLNVNVDKPIGDNGEDFDLEASLVTSPALRERMKIMLQRAEKKALPS